MAAAGDNQLYRAEAEAALARAELEGLTLIYHRRSGLTHLLASPAPEMIDALADEAMSVAALAAHLAERYDLTADEGDAEAVIAARLAELVALGLARPA
jgi:PqqD family protein of HPr-rel-A system